MNLIPRRSHRHECGPRARSLLPMWFETLRRSLWRHLSMCVRNHWIGPQEAADVASSIWVRLCPFEPLTGIPHWRRKADVALRGRRLQSRILHNRDPEERLSQRRGA